MKIKIAIVNQRYGPEVNGGSEQHTKMLAERLARIPEYDIEILTTCALDHTTWENHYPRGLTEINNIKVRRFPIERQRDMQEFKEFSDSIFLDGNKSPEIEQKWADMQGPYCPQCIDYIRQHKEQYDVFIFFTYLHYITIRGMPETGKKAIFVPTAHDEPPVYLDIFKDVFKAPGAIAFNSPEEREMLYNLFDIKHIPGDIIGAGADIPENAQPERFRGKYKTGNYLLFAGRIEEGKNCHVLADFFIRYKGQNPSDLKLVFIGKEFHPLPRHPDIVLTGFIPEEEKTDAIAGAKLFVLPSMFESLSLVVLEAMALGIPVLVNGKCNVTKGHCLRSNAGLYFDGYFEFESCINYLLSPEHSDIYTAMRENAREYVKTNYRWDVVIDKYKKMIKNLSF